MNQRAFAICTALLATLLAAPACKSGDEDGASTRQPAKPERGGVDNANGGTDAAPRVRARLFAGTQEVRPGMRVPLGVHFVLEPEWHVYWDNPGDSGLRTRVEFEAPNGFSVSDPEFPGPKRFVSPGGVVSYGYDNESVLLAELVAPEDLQLDSEVTITARTRWVACNEDSCVPGKDSLSLTLRTAADERPAPRADAALLAKYRARLPKPLGELEGATASWSGDAKILTLTVPTRSKVTFFPARGLPTTTAVTSAPFENGTRIEIDLSSGSREGDVAGVLRVEEPQPRFFSVSLPAS